MHLTFEMFEVSFQFVNLDILINRITTEQDFRRVRDDLLENGGCNGSNGSKYVPALSWWQDYELFDCSRLLLKGGG